MPEPISLCLEDTAEGGFTRCVAISGGLPGLRLGVSGAILWRESAPAACELWVSADERLVLFRLEGAPRVVLRRGARTLDVPEKKPVIVLHGDEVDAGGRSFRIHVHGLASGPAAPERLTFESTTGRLAGAAAVVALGAALTGCPQSPSQPGPSGSQTPPIEVRDKPPEVSLPSPRATPPAPAATPIEVRERPPAPVAPSPSPTAAPTPSPTPIEVREQPPKPAPPPTEAPPKPPR